MLLRAKYEVHELLRSQAVGMKKKRARQGVRVRRVVRRVELGSLFRLALAFHLLCWAVSVAVLAILAKIVEQLGLLGKIEKFLQDAGFAKGFKINLSLLLRGAAGIGLALVVVAVIATLLLGFFFNGLSGLLGGLVFSVLEERSATTGPEAVPAPATPAPSTSAASDATWHDATTMWDTPEQSGQATGTVV